MAGGEENLLQKISSPRVKLLQKCYCPVTFSFKKCICPAFMNNKCCIVLSTIDELAKDLKAVPLSMSSCQWLMKPSWKKLKRKFGVIDTHFCIHFSTCMIDNFVIIVSHFKSSSYLEHIKSYCLVQARSYLLYKKCWQSCVQPQKK